jgi:ferredoxin-type protein NapF
MSRGLVLVAALMVLGPLAHRSVFPALVSALSPYTAVGSALAARAFPLLVWLAVVIGVLTILRRRFFCEWLCPVGLILDGTGKVGRACGRPSARPRRWGSWLVWLTVGSAAVGLPLFLWLDPLAIQTAAFSVLHPEAGIARWYAGLLVVVLLLLNCWWPGQWCRQVCPLGAFQDELFIGARAVQDQVQRRRATPRTAHRGVTASRRAWLGAAGGAIAAGVLRRAQGAPAVVRPPGALAETSFVGVCLRCGNCLRACPSGVIHSSGVEGGWLGLCTPRLSFAEDYCREDCVRCGEVCPSGALQRTSLNLKPALDLGQPKVRMDLCLLAEERECSHCRNWCPYGAVTYVFSEETYLVEPRVDFDRCNGCGACEAHCPVRPARAIVVERTGAEG